MKVTQLALALATVLIAVDAAPKAWPISKQVRCSKA